MPFYDYRVKTQSGKVQKGKVEAASVARAAETLQQKGLFIIRNIGRRLKKRK